MADTPKKGLLEAMIKRLRAPKEQEAEAAKEGAEAMAEKMPEVVMPKEALKKQKAKMQKMDEMLRESDK